MSESEKIIGGGKKIKATKGGNGFRLNVSDGKSGTFNMVQA